MKGLAARLLAVALLLAGCAPAGTPPKPADHKIRIGFSFDTLHGERWQRDRDMFVARARELGAEVTVQAAASDDYLQLSQVENMLRRGIDVLVVVAHSASAMAPAVALAHRAGVKVIAYDRLMTGADVDFYISFDSERVGELQAEYMTRHVPRGNYVYIGGAPTDHNTFLLRQGTFKVLEPFIRTGAIRLVMDVQTADWRADLAEQQMEEVLTKAGGQVDAVIAASDRMAGGVLQALLNHELAGRISVAGQNADLAAVRRIAQGAQAMTVYKPIRLMATQAAEIAMAIARGEVPPANETVYNGSREVPARLFQPVAVDRENILQTVIRDNFHRSQDVFAAP